MKARRPVFDYQHTPVHWSKHHGYSVDQNAASILIPILEPYLNRVMAMAKADLGEKCPPHVAEEVDLFILQEGAHYIQHRRQAQVFYKQYPDLPKYEAALKQDYEDFLKNKSLKFNTAYCEGFESSGILTARYFFERSDQFLDGADQSVVDMWAWHLAEELEHRMVCYDVQKLFGGYIARMRGMFFAARHLAKHHSAIANYMLSVDRSQMTPADVEQSKRQYKEYKRHMGRFIMPRVLQILSPFYNPKNAIIPPKAAEVLAQLDSKAEAA
jgi:predicted metal-dependent hydrolase